ncbi:MAG TPA: DUF3800 domain-containing protein, partial [Stellaceae bacterium]|nr:DUF3800 domain-containing protein [Stellaceae bacterium]
ADETRLVIEGRRDRSVHKGEFKFSKCTDAVRDEFCRDVSGCPFRVRAIVVQKAKIRSEHLRGDRKGFYRYFLGQVVKKTAGLTGARIVIDGSGDRLFRQQLAAALRAETGRVKDVRFKDSARDPLVQLADMMAGAVARSYRPDRPDAFRWRKAIRSRIEDVWEFR